VTRFITPFRLDGSALRPGREDDAERAAGLASPRGSAAGARLRIDAAERFSGPEAEDLVAMNERRGAAAVRDDLPLLVEHDEARVDRRQDRVDDGVPARDLDLLAKALFLGASQVGGSCRLPGGSRVHPHLAASVGSRMQRSQDVDRTHRPHRRPRPVSRA
jgi:hypothetical protein